MEFDFKIFIVLFCTLSSLNHPHCFWNISSYLSNFKNKLERNKIYSINPFKTLGCRERERERERESSVKILILNSPLEEFPSTPMVSKNRWMKSRTCLAPGFFNCDLLETNKQSGLLVQKPWYSSPTKISTYVFDDRWLPFTFLYFTFL